MANHKSSEKRARQTIKRTAVNKARTGNTRTAVKKVRVAIETKNKPEALSLFPMAQKLLQKLAKSGIVKNNLASRTISRLADQINKL